MYVHSEGSLHRGHIVIDIKKGNTAFMQGTLSHIRVCMYVYSICHLSTFQFLSVMGPFTPVLSTNSLPILDIIEATCKAKHTSNESQFKKTESFPRLFV